MDAFLLLLTRLLSQNTLFFDRIAQIHNDCTSVNGLVNGILYSGTFPNDTEEIYIYISIDIPQK
jgi:hypothetical protein